jgi:hypothetical protein
MNGNFFGNGDTCTVSFQGRLIVCDNVDDALAIRRADRVLNDAEKATATELRELAKVLLSYGCLQAAEAMLAQLTKQRAARFLSRTVGYRRPRDCG